MNGRPRFADTLLDWTRPARPAREEEPTLATWVTGGRSAYPAWDEPRPPCALHFDPDHVFWAMQNLPVREARHHFLLLGATGSGKTIKTRLFLQSIAPRFLPGAARPEQLIVSDGKGDMVSLLDSMGLAPGAGNVWILNPFDARSAVWNLSDALGTPAMARFLARLLVPEEKNSSAPYFADAARELIFATILALNNAAPGCWTLRDLLCALDSKARIRAVTARHPRAHELADRILSDELHADGVVSTLGTKIGPFESVAALWHTNKTGRVFSIDRFLAEPGVLILGNDPVLRESFWPVNALLLKALTQEILRRSETLELRHWFVLDEFRAMQRVDCVHDLLNLGRSKGVSVLLGTQSLEGLIEVYGEQVANELLSQCAQKSILRLGGPKSAQWAEQLIGKIRRMETVITKSSSQSGSSVSHQKSLQERALFLASYFLDLPLPQPGGDYMAVCDLPSQQSVVVLRRPFEEVLAWCRPPSATPNVVPRPDADQWLQPWTPEEVRRFCGGSPTPAAPPPPSQPADSDLYLPRRRQR